MMNQWCAWVLRLGFKATFARQDSAGILDQIELLRS